MTAAQIAMVRSDCQEMLKERAVSLHPLKGTTLVITGGMGFVGTWLTEFVAVLNDTHGFHTNLVLIARDPDRFQASRPHLAKRQDVTLVASDVRRMVELPKETHWVVHCAAIPDVRFHASHPIDTMSIIADGTAALLRAVDRCTELKMLVNLSSGLVYGTQPWGLERIGESFQGELECGALSSVYAEAKRFAETLCTAARSQARIPIIQIRPFAFLGPYQSLENPWAVTNFIQDAFSGSIIRVLGDGQTVRSYMYGSDMAYWILRILTAGASGKCYNLGSPDPISLEALAKLIATQFTPAPEIRLRMAHSQHVPKTRFVPDVAAAQRDLGLTTSLPLQEAVRRTIEWHRAEVEARAGAQEG